LTNYLCQQEIKGKTLHAKPRGRHGCRGDDVALAIFPRAIVIYMGVPCVSVLMGNEGGLIEQLPSEGFYLLELVVVT